MNRTRIATFALALVAALMGSGATVGSAQVETGPTPPDPGETFEGFLTGSVGFDPVDGPSEACPSPVRTITDASGPTTLGEVTLHSEHCPTSGVPTVSGGVQTITDAAGDRLDGVYFVDCDPVMPGAPSGEVVTCVGRFRIDGGTGKYRAATGSLHETVFVWFSGEMSAQDWPWMAKLEGVIDY